MGCVVGVSVLVVGVGVLELLLSGQPVPLSKQLLLSALLVGLVVIGVGLL